MCVIAKLSDDIKIGVDPIDHSHRYQILYCAESWFFDSLTFDELIRFLLSFITVWKEEDRVEVIERETRTWSGIYLPTNIGVERSSRPVSLSDAAFHHRRRQ